MADHLHKRHNVTLLLYHLVFPVKYRRKVFTPTSELSLKTVCTEVLAVSYEINFVEIGIDKDHAHFLIQLPPTMSVSEVVTKIKSITGKYLFLHHPDLRKILWGGNFWTMGYYANTVGQYGNFAMIQNYMQKQGLPEYKQLHQDMTSLFE